MTELTAAAQWLNDTFYSFDYAILEFFHNTFNQGAGSAFWDPFFKFVTLLGEEGLFFIIISIIMMLFKKTRKAGMAMLLAIGVGALITNVSVKPLIARPRPFQNELSDCFEALKQWWIDAGSTKVGEKSFPSGHTTSAMAAMAGYFFASKKKYISWTALLFAVLMGCSRIYLCVHYPSDILGGIVAGVLAGFIAYLLINLLYSKTNNKGINAMVEWDIRNLFKKKTV